MYEGMFGIKAGECFTEIKKVSLALSSDTASEDPK